MENNGDDLKNAVDSIKKYGTTKGLTITGEEIAGKIGITEKQLNAFLQGEEQTPDGLAFRLRRAYNFSTVIVRSTKTVRVRTSKPPGKKPQNKATRKEKLEKIISYIKACGEKKGTPITDEDIALKTGISPEQLKKYMDGSKTPGGLVASLFTVYADVLNTAQMESNRKSLAHSIVLIRNRGLAAGMDITAAEMAQKIDLSKEQLHAYLRGEYDTMDPLPFQLESAYKALLKNAESTEVIEDIHMIMRRDGASE